MKVERTRHVYVIENPTLSQVKIGIATELRSRFSTIQGSAGCKLKLVYNSEKIKGAELYEATIHEFFKEFRTVGEWFKIDAKTAINKTNEIVSRAEPDEIIYMYKKGISINDIAKDKGMSRSGIIKHITKAGEYKNSESNSADKKIILTDCDTLMCSIRLGKNMYSNPSKNKFAYRIYNDGKFKGILFDSLDKLNSFAKEYL